MPDVDHFQAGQAVRDNGGGTVGEIVAHQIEAGRVDQIALAIRHKGAGAGQEGRTPGIGDGEEAIALDCQIGRRRRVLSVPGSEIA